MTDEEWADYLKVVVRRVDELIARQSPDKNVAQLATLANDRIKNLVYYLNDE